MDLEEAIKSAISSHAEGELDRWKLELIKRRAEVLRFALNAAVAFIDSHVADPDLSEGMVSEHAEYQMAMTKLFRESSDTP